MRWCWQSQARFAFLFGWGVGLDIGNDFAPDLRSVEDGGGHAFGRVDRHDNRLVVVGHVVHLL
jgi:hypothetical protein